MPIQTEEQRQRALTDAGVSAASLPTAPPAPATPPSLPTAGAPIDASVLGGVQPFKLPDAPSLPSYNLSTLPSIEALSNPAPTATQQAQDALGQRALADTAKLGTKTAAQIKAEDAAGLPGFNKQLNDINAQLRDLQTQSASAYNTSEDRLAPTFAIRGEQAQIERQRSVKALGLSAIAQSIQGNIALAQSQANRAVEVEFAPVQAELDYITKALELNRDKLTAEESKRKDQLTIQLAERQRLLDQAKENKNIIYGWTAEAAKNGASSLLINQAIGASDPMQALQILTPFMSDPAAKEQALAQLEATRTQTAAVKANTAATYAGIEKTKADTAKTKAETTQTTNSKGQLLNLVGQYRTLVKDTNFFSATFDPSVRAKLDTLKGQITATYKQQQQLGTLDQGVQKLIDTIFPSPGAFSITSFSPQAQVDAIDNFITNQGGTPGGDQYATYRSQLNSGEVLVQRGNQIMAVTSKEVKPTDIKL